MSDLRLSGKEAWDERQMERNKQQFRAKYCTFRSQIGPDPYAGRGGIEIEAWLDDCLSAAQAT
jgi:hypothetical protein